MLRNDGKDGAYKGALNGLSRPPKRSCPDSFLPPSPPPVEN